MFGFVYLFYFEPGDLRLSWCDRYTLNAIKTAQKKSNLDTYLGCFCAQKLEITEITF